MIQKYFPTALWLTATLGVVLLTLNQQEPGCHVLTDEHGIVSGYACSAAGGNLFIAGAMASVMLPLVLLTNRNRQSISTLLKLTAFVGATLAYVRADIIAMGAMGVLNMVGRCIPWWFAIAGISAGMIFLFQRVVKLLDEVAPQQQRVSSPFASDDRNGAA
jgi:hypothetical protein